MQQSENRYHRAGHALIAEGDPRTRRAANGNCWQTVPEGTAAPVVELWMRVVAAGPVAESLARGDSDEPPKVDGPHHDAMYDLASRFQAPGEPIVNAIASAIEDAQMELRDRWPEVEEAVARSMS